jgi:hypothetical protein
MGLAERRGIKAFQENEFVALKAQVNEAAGFEVPLDVDWDSIGADGYAHMYDVAFAKVYFQPLVAALDDVCRDEMGRKALAEGLTRVVVKNSNHIYGGKGIVFEDGVLTIDHLPVTNIDDVQIRTTRIVQVLEDGL